MILWLACSTPDATDALHAPEETAAPEPSGETGDTALRTDLTVAVTLDGQPVADVVVMQAGASSHVTTDGTGVAELTLDPEVPGERFVVASHPEARQGWDYVPSTGDLSLALSRYDTSDNADYSFDPPGVDGTLTGSPTTDYCGHCHKPFIEEFVTSMHNDAASDVQVQDLYAGVATSRDEASCESVGGAWRTGLEPGTRAALERCYVGHGVLPDLNESCGESTPCDAVATAFGGCADCHAPGIDGELGGRDLLEATGTSFDHGVHCDVCHKVESIDTDGAPGVGGWLRLLRPSEKSPTPAFDYLPLTFCPSHDSPNVRMGCVQRDHFQEAGFCGGCHQLDQGALVPGASLDEARWPEGTLPVHSTYAEWLAGPYADAAACQSCHMPPAPELQNSLDLGDSLEGEPGYVNGVARDPGTVRHHYWPGAWHPDSALLDLAAQVEVEVEQGDELLVAVTTKNIGPGHALPTGEPLRHLVLTVSAACGGEPLEATGGDVVWDVGGGERRAAGDDWQIWPAAAVGDVLTVVSVSGWHDYTGHGRFGDGSFSEEERGLPDEDLVGSSTITSVDDDGRVELDAELPEGDAIYRSEAWSAPADGQTSLDRAGQPGFAFARVLVDEQGERMVPHHRATDVAVDNRLLPMHDWTSEHRFEGGCDDPSVEAALLYRRWPSALAEQRGWEATDRLMAVGVR